MNVANSVQEAIEAVDREVSLLSEMEREAVADGTTLAPLRASWRDLRSQLVLGLVPGAPWGVQKNAKGSP
jgi:hypothetical protein